MTKLTIKSDKRLKIELQKRSTDNRTGHIAFQFQIGPFKKSMASTIGSALRRTLLSLSETVSITSAFGNLYNGNSLREDLFELSLNLQKVTIKSSFFPYMGVARIRKKGPAIITAQDILVQEGLKIVNPYQYICTLNESYTLDLSIIISSPTMNQGINQINPINPLDFTQTNYFQEQENKIKVPKNLLKILFPKGDSSEIVLDNNREELTKDDNLLSAKKVSSPGPIINKTSKKLENGKFLSDESNKNDLTFKSQNVPIDIILVDPIYSSIQSCSFEVTQTTKSSVSEYEKLVEYGITDTDEFLQFVLVSRGAIEPVEAIQFAANELRNDLIIFDTLPHLFASENNLFLNVEKTTFKTKMTKIRSNISQIYINEIIKNFDIRHLSLPPKLELFLRRQGFVSLENLISIPVSFFKNIGLTQDEFKTIESSIKNFGLYLINSKKINWDLIPSSLGSKKF
uniref:RNA polymerase subunit alpha n=1 Tax=Eustigmatophyceae sp. Mont 10/10-1w TaxID=2506145 RepID=A0A451FMP5_9STRA|nr:RNA polymerase subunit alpha [Eustigmatophyceae sp. Mont 10/10-1w]QAA11684.1 RNA polymerase subunit alpha [Eustigmatophyceae sp. Mont 10/10-1w]